MSEQKSIPVGGKKYFEAKHQHPYHSREDMLEKILEMVAEIESLKKAVVVPESAPHTNNDKVIEGMSAEINYLKEELNKVWERIIELEKPKDDKPKTDTENPS